MKSSERAPTRSAGPQPSTSVTDSVKERMPPKASLPIEITAPACESSPSIPALSTFAAGSLIPGRDPGGAGGPDRCPHNYLRSGHGDEQDRDRAAADDLPSHRTPAGAVAVRPAHRHQPGPERPDGSEHFARRHAEPELEPDLHRAVQVARQV